MSKYTFKEIKHIINTTPAELKNKFIHEVVSETKSRELGYFAPSTTNWCYRVHAIEHNNHIIEVVEVFGKIQ